MSLARRVAGRVQAKPDGIIRSHRGEGLAQARSRAELWRQAGDIAAALSGAGAVPASFVVILATDILDFLPSSWACLRGGFTPVALMHAAQEALHRQDGGFQQVLSLLRDPVIVVDEYFASMASRLPGVPMCKVVPLATVMPAEAWADHAGSLDTAWIVATSGSAGRPKLVAVSTDAMLFRNFAQHPATSPPLPNALGTFPLDGLTGQHAAFLHYDSWTQIAAPVLTANPAAILDAIETYEIAALTLANSMIPPMLVAEAGSSRRRRLGSLRRIGLGAEPIMAGVVQDFAALLARHGADPKVLIAGYGATETGSLVAGSSALLTSTASEPVCLGQPWDGVAMRIVDERGTILPEGDIGELEISCPAKMFSSYFGDPEHTAAAFTSDGWWRSGDLGQLIAGQLTLRGRAKDMLIQNGRKLHFADIDAEVHRVLGPRGAGHGYALPATEDLGEGLGIAFDTGGMMAEPDAAAAITTAIIRRFGLQPRQVVAVPADHVPRTAAGKVKRGLLAALAMQTGAPARPVLATARPVCEPGPSAIQLGAIWSDVLGLDRAARLDDDFFALGGDSLRAVALDLQIVEKLGVRIPSEVFFAAPSFGNLLRSVLQYLAAASQTAKEDSPDRDRAWPLPPALRHGLLSALVHWPGERRSNDAMIAGYNLDGDRPPIFWVFNYHDESVRLAKELGPHQPLYAMRSGFQLIDYTEDEIQSLALRYVSEIMELRPDGPIFLAGNCQGGIIALAIGHHLLRRKRLIPLLVLVDWGFELHPYPGRVLLISGADNVNLNPRRLHACPERAWARCFAEYDFVEVSGGYAEIFQAGHIDGLVRTLLRHMHAALAMPQTLIPDSGYRATITASAVPKHLRPGECRTLLVSIRNDSDIIWAATPVSGLVLSSRWLDSAGDRTGPSQPCAPIGIVEPAQSATVSLAVEAPDTIGDFTLVIDVLEDGNRWFGTDADRVVKAPVKVVPRYHPWDKSLPPPRSY